MASGGMMNTPNNRTNISRDGKSSTYDRSMTSYMKSRTPYNYNVLDSDESKNTKYKYFQNVGMRRPEAIAKNSVTLNNDYNNTAFSSIDQDRSFSDVMYATASEDKPGRLRDYRTMAAFSEIADALDEICDETINPDENDDIVILKFKNSDLESEKREEIQAEFSKYMEYFDLHNNGWQYFRQFLTEGELYFEQIIHEDYVNEGVLGVINIPADLIDPVYGNIQNMLVKGFLYQKPIFDKNDPRKVEKYEPIPYEENQVVYINNSSYNETKEFIVPFIENARRAYRQLSMIEDAVVIHRMVHAPLRFVFNVDVGRLNVPQAEAYLRKLQAQYWSTKTFDGDNGDIVKKYSPQSTLDSYWFAKRQGTEPTTVQEIGGQGGLDQIQDLYFFIKKLYRSLKTPASRLDPEDAFRDGTDILREELKFARMIMRQQQKFASGLKRGFITHLKLRKMFKEYDLTEQNVNVIFNPPSNFYDLRNNQKLELKINSFNNLVNTQKISVAMAMKKALGWKDREILANRGFLETEAAFEWKLQQILTLGPDWQNQIIAQANAGAPPESGGADMGLGGGGGAPLDVGMGGSIDNNENAMGLGQEAPPNAGNAPESAAVPEEAPI
jgi:hypothetical protein